MIWGGGGRVGSGPAPKPSESDKPTSGSECPDRPLERYRIPQPATAYYRLTVNKLQGIIASPIGAFLIGQ